MSKDDSTIPKTFHRPTNMPLLKVPQVSGTTLLTKQTTLASSHFSISSAALVAEERNAIGAISATDTALSSASRTSTESPRLDARKLQDRVISCLALQSGVKRAWKISMPLRKDLAPLSWMRLENDPTGRLALKLSSKLPSVVEAMTLQIPSLIAALVPWSFGTPTVEVNFDLNP
jgi:hypothetical protein